MATESRLSRLREQWSGALLPDPPPAHGDERDLERRWYVKGWNDAVLNSLFQMGVALGESVDEASKALPPNVPPHQPVDGETPPWE